MAKINTKTATKYQANTPELYIEHCRKGGSTAEFCRDMMVSDVTLGTWCKTYPAMAEAKKMGKRIAEGWWLEQARNHLVIHNDQDCGTTKFDTNLYKFIVSGRFGHTSDKAFMLRIAELERALAAMNAATISRPAYAEMAECEPDDNNKIK